MNAPRTQIKICCIQNTAEADMAIQAGAHVLGLVSKMPSGPGPIPEERIAEIAAHVPDQIATFLLTSEQDPHAIIHQHHRCKTTALQLVDAVSIPALQKLRAELPDISLVQVIHVTGEEAMDQAHGIEEFVDYILLDSGNPTAPVKELGGTGRVHNWDISARIVEAVEKPVFLAGGLNPQNVKAAIEQVQPHGVDLCSGVRSDGCMDSEKLKRYVEAL